MYDASSSLSSSIHAVVMPPAQQQLTKIDTTQKVVSVELDVSSSNSLAELEPPPCAWPPPADPLVPHLPQLFGQTSDAASKLQPSASALGFHIRVLRAHAHKYVRLACTHTATQ